jgi:RNA polymerase II subunit A small phosphatase-like protein
MQKLDLDPHNKAEDVPSVDSDEIRHIFLSGGTGIPIGSVSASPSLLNAWILIFCQTKDGVPRPLLPPIAPQHIGRKCLVLDLDETLVHGTFKVCARTPYNNSFLRLPLSR